MRTGVVGGRSCAGYRSESKRCTDTILLLHPLFNFSMALLYIPYGMVTKMIIGTRMRNQKWNNKCANVRRSTWPSSSGPPLPHGIILVYPSRISSTTLYPMQCDRVMRFRTANTSVWSIECICRQKYDTVYQWNQNRNAKKPRLQLLFNVHKLLVSNDCCQVHILETNGTVLTYWNTSRKLHDKPLSITNRGVAARERY